MKDQLEKIAQVQKDHHEAVKKSLFLSLSSTKTRVEVADDLLRRGNQVEVLAAKSGITQQLTGVNSASAMLQKMISYDLEVDSALDQRILQNF